MIEKSTIQNSVKRNLSKLTKNLIPLAIIAAVVIIGAALIYTNPSFLKNLKGKEGANLVPTTKEGILSSQEAADKAINYINKNILAGQATATLKEVTEEGDLYKVKFNIGEREFDSYATKDGKLFFPEAIDLNSNPSQQNQPSEQSQPSGQTPTEIPKAEKPNVKLFVMSFCPYGNQAEESMIPVVDLLKDKINFEFHYVIYSNYGGGGPNYCFDSENKYCSMHGIQELHQDVRELCVWKYQKDKFWDFIKEINKGCSSQNADTCWEGVANKLGINTQKIKDCQENESLSFLKEELSINQKYGVKGSPQLFINDVEYNGERGSEGYKNGICSAFQTKPGECNQALSNGTTQPAAGGCE